MWSVLARHPPPGAFHLTSSSAVPVNSHCSGFLRINQEKRSISFIVFKKDEGAKRCHSDKGSQVMPMQLVGRNLHLRSVRRRGDSFAYMRKLQFLIDNNHLGSCGVHSAPKDGPYLPSLMKMPFPTRTWPRLINSIRNWFFIYFVIKPYMDREFDIHEFIRGAKQALTLVSNCIATGQYDEIEDIVDPHALSQIKMSVASFTAFQRDLLKVATDDIFFTFPYQIGIMIPEPVRQEGDKMLPQTRHVEITVVFHILRGFAEQAKAGGDTKTFQDFIKSEETKYNVMICNYRFFRDFTQGADNPSWIINLVNHFLPADRIFHKSDDV